ncbi:MAG: geranylgeranylglycerol-phosphate geranylgeranyltransferase [Microscillaceae bacterium]
MQAALQKLPRNFDLAAFFKLIRLNNLLIIALTQAMIKVFLVDEGRLGLYSLQDWALWGIVGATLAIAAAGYIINDYYDIKIDTINKPERVVVGRVLKRRVALVANFVLNLAGLALAFPVSWAVFGITLGSGFLLWLYSNQLKRRPLIGNVVIALLTAASVVVLAAYYPTNQDLVIVFALFAFFITLVREIVKDMEDVRGDADFGCKTLPIVWGMRRTKRVIYTFLAIFAIILLSTYLTFPRRFVFYLYVVVLPPLLWFTVRLYWADTRRTFAFLSSLCKWIMVLGVLSMALV